MTAPRADIPWLLFELGRLTARMERLEADTARLREQLREPRRASRPDLTTLIDERVAAKVRAALDELAAASVYRRSDGVDRAPDAVEFKAAACAESDQVVVGAAGLVDGVGHLVSDGGQLVGQLAHELAPSRDGEGSVGRSPAPPAHGGAGDGARS